MKKSRKNIVNAIAKRYFKGERKTSSDREILIEILAESVENYLNGNLSGLFIDHNNIRVVHYLQKIDFEGNTAAKMFEGFDIEEVFDFLAILDHDSDHHPWIMDEVYKAFKQYVRTGADKDKKITLFRSPKIKISFNAEKRRLKLIRYTQRGGNIERPKKYYVQLNTRELI
jgi:hypothetical protein